MCVEYSYVGTVWVVWLRKHEAGAHSEDKSGDKQQKTTGRTCGQCKQPGHTKRTCPDLVGTSSRAGE